MTITANTPEPMRYVLVAKLRSYLDMHEDAIRFLSEGLERHPGNALLLRHRGEFLLTVRRYPESIADLSAAAAALETTDDVIDPYRAQLLPEMDRILLGREPLLLHTTEPADAAAVAKYEGIYIGSLKSSTWYHLALAQYLMADYQTAAETYLVTERHALLPDTGTAIRNWRYLTARRLGDDDGAAALLANAPATDDNAEPSYARNLEIYRGNVAPELPSEFPLRSRVTVGYGAGAWLLAEGRVDEAIATLRQVVAAGDTPAFGHIAALGDLERLGVQP